MRRTAPALAAILDGHHGPLRLLRARTSGAYETIGTMFRKSWHVHVAREVSLPTSANGSPVLTPGDYVLREIDLSAYDIVSAATKVRLGFSHIFRMQRSGAIRIDAEPQRQRGIPLRSRRAAAHDRAEIRRHPFHQLHRRGRAGCLGADLHGIQIRGAGFRALDSVARVSQHGVRSWARCFLGPVVTALLDDWPKAKMEEALGERCA